MLYMYIEGVDRLYRSKFIDKTDGRQRGQLKIQFYFQIEQDHAIISLLKSVHDILNSKFD